MRMIILKLFQFQNGAVKRFSSVRIGVDLSLFQFQNGAVKRVVGSGVLLIPFVFQFQNGAVKRDNIKVLKLVSVCISIPKWCC